MKTLISTARKLTLYIFAAVLVGGAPMAAFAEEPVPSEEDGGYVYDIATGRWNSNKWRYDPATNTYVPNVQAPTPEPAEDIIETGPDSSNEVVDAEAAAVQNDTSNHNKIDNDVTGVSSTGSAQVKSNNTAGSAASGDAAAIATIMNAINSSTALGGGQPYVFTSDIYGDVYGDIELAPELLKGMADVTAQNTGSVNYKVVDKNAINNEVDLGALSGDAAVLDNTKAGGAASGDATAIANVLNIINSVISANRSFIGTINIHGNLDGDILMSKDNSPSLIASNAGSNPLTAGTLLVNQTNLTDIINNIELDATSGEAKVDNNAVAGSAKSGTAKTNLVVMDLAGHNVVAKNSLLVFVNVLGKWVGIIVDAPTGATAAVLSDDVTTHLIAAMDGDTTIDSESQNKIVNNIKVGAHTGDATVAGNTEAGDATTGDASASANILNMVNSAFSVSDWFGVLFINVLGSWYGSFGVDTPQGDEVAASPPPAAEQSSAPSAPTQVFRFIARAASGMVEQTGASIHSTVETQQSQDAVLAASNHSALAPVAATQDSSGPVMVSLPVAIAGLLGLVAGTVLFVRLIGAARSRSTGV